tara:strand:- start:921 stop:1640 length:720 start_codon:yes stop_codon:yes gene_type:complete
MPGSLEIPIEHVDTARVTVGHADRLEVCDELQTDGWSPSCERLSEIVRVVATSSVEVVSLIRPRCCPDFLVSSDAVSQARADIEAAARAGAHGIVLGFIDHLNHLDEESMGDLSSLARSFGLTISLHRAFDFDEDLETAVRIASECGAERILTSGACRWESAAASLESRVARIRESVRLSVLHATRLGRPPVRVVACGGVRASNASHFLEATPDLHASCRHQERFHPDLLEALLGAMQR